MELVEVWYRPEKIILQQGNIKFELTDEMLSALFDLLMSMKGDK